MLPSASPRETSTVSGPQNILLSRGLSQQVFYYHTKSQRNKKKRTSEEKTKKFLLNFVKTVKFNSVHNLNSEYKK